MDPTTALKKRLPDELTGVTAPGGYSFDELYRFAQVCHASGLFEDTTDAAQAMVKIVRGAELGLPPTTAMTAFDIIRKRLFVKPWVIAAKIQACGYGAFRVQEQTNERCVIVFRRKDPVTGWYDCPDVTYTFPARPSSPVPRYSRPAFSSVIVVPCTIPCGPMYMKLPAVICP